MKGPSERADLLGLLQEVEWSPEDGCCFFCGGHEPAKPGSSFVPSHVLLGEPVGHAADCRLDAFLKEA